MSNEHKNKLARVLMRGHENNLLSVRSVITEGTASLLKTDITKLVKAGMTSDMAHAIVEKSNIEFVGPSPTHFGIEYRARAIVFKPEEFVDFIVGIYEAGLSGKEIEL